MSVWFPELTRDILDHTLRDGICVSQGEVEPLEILAKLRELGIVGLNQRMYVKCVWRADYDFGRRENLDCPGRVEVLPEMDSPYCPVCGQPILEVQRKTRLIETEVTLDSKGIENYLSQALQVCAPIAAVESIGPGVFSCESKAGRQLRVILPDLSPEYRTQADLLARTRIQSAGLFFAEPTLYVYSSSVHKPIGTPLSEAQYIGLADLLSLPKPVVEQKLAVASVPIEGRRELGDVEGAFDAMIARHAGDEWSFFEQEFSTSLMNYLSDHPQSFEAYLETLARLSATVYGEYYVPVGGAGKPDFIAIDKYDLVLAIARGNIEGEAKCKLRSTLSDNDMAKTIHHLVRSSAGADTAVILMASDRVASTAWTSMMEMRRDASWMIVIVPKYLVLELIDAVGAEAVLDL